MGFKFFHFLRNLTLILGASFFVFSIYPILQYQKTSSWPAVEGVITASQLRDGGALFLGMGSVYHADITFDYVVDGIKYSGNRIQYGIGGKSYIFKQFALRTVERYPVGKTTSIHYNPGNPTDEIVELTPALGFSFFWIVITVLCFGLAIVISIKKMGPQTEANPYQNLPLRPQQGTTDSELKDFYPTQIYNPPKVEGQGQQRAHAPKQSATQDEQHDRDHGSSPVSQEFVGDYPSLVYSPPPTTNSLIVGENSNIITILIPIIGWRLLIILDRDKN